MKIEEKTIYEILKQNNIKEEEVKKIIQQMSFLEIKKRVENINKKTDEKIEELVDLVLKDITLAIIESLLQSNNSEGIFDLRKSYLDCIKDCKN